MKKIYIIVILLICTLNTFSQSQIENLIIIQKFYNDTLLSDYRKVKFEINLKTNLVTRMNYFTTHRVDTSYVGEVIKEKFYLNERAEKRIIGDTIFNQYDGFTGTDTLPTMTKKVYGKYGIVYSARIFPKENPKPLNESTYEYNKIGDLIKIKESYNPTDGYVINYKIVFTYDSGVVTRIKKYKKGFQNWTTENIWDFKLLGNYNLKRKIETKINSLLIDRQFKNPQW